MSYQVCKVFILVYNSNNLYLFLYSQFVDGEPIYKGSCRTNIGGFHVTDYLKQLLSLKYPYHL